MVGAVCRKSSLGTGRHVFSNQYQPCPQVGGVNGEQHFHIHKQADSNTREEFGNCDVPRSQGHIAFSREFVLAIVANV